MNIFYLRNTLTIIDISETEAILDEVIPNNNSINLISNVDILEVYALMNNYKFRKLYDLNEVVDIIQSEDILIFDSLTIKSLENIARTKNAKVVHMQKQ